MFLITCLLYTLHCVLYNWEVFGPEQKGISDSEAKKIFKADININWISNSIFLVAHWLFAAQYLDVSELLAQVTNTKQICNKLCRNIITAVMSLLIVLIMILPIFVMVS